MGFEGGGGPPDIGLEGGGGPIFMYMFMLYYEFMCLRAFVSTTASWLKIFFVVGIFNHLFFFAEVYKFFRSHF